ncbi:VWA-like domain-containing protein [Sulfurimonas sp. HSL-1716]|uniref:vWA domain-containing protein n=1 Tax=Hydrocurvibacter sulfurireducens TaxID=3131937 RepID=UPI0031F92BE8
MSLQAKISRAKAKLLVDYPYFGTLASRLKLIKNENISAFLSDGTKLEYNDEYLKSLEISELEFALSNGAMHTVLSHQNRKNSRYGWLWQLSTDYAINSMLVQNGLDMPLGVNYDPRFEGLYAEEIYEILRDEIKNEEFSDNESDETGFNEDNKRHNNKQNSSGSSDKKDENAPKMEVENIVDEELLSTMNEKLIQDELIRGDLPLGLDRFFDLTSSSKIDWREKLRDAIDRFYKDDYRVLPPAKKLLYLGTYLPSLTSNRFKLTIAIDSSGSVDEQMLSSFMSEVNSIMLSISNYEIDILVADAKVYSHETFYEGDELLYTLKGGGGTDFRPVFEYIEQNLYDTALLLYFTDLNGMFPKEQPLYNVAWIAPKKSDIPFGELIVMD